jgi:hypothetical protein
MTVPTSDQLERARTLKLMPISGAHTVGAVDGGPGLPITGWSREHGDLRVPHFIGLHALQALALVAFAVRRRSTEAVRVRIVSTAVASYIALYAILLWRALAGHSLISPDATGLTMLALWVMVSAAALALSMRPKRVAVAAGV